MLNLIMTVNQINAFSFIMVGVLAVIVIADMLKDESKTFHVDA